MNTATLRPFLPASVWLAVTPGQVIYMPRGRSRQARAAGVGSIAGVRAQFVNALGASLALAALSRCRRWRHGRQVRRRGVPD